MAKKKFKPPTLQEVKDYIAEKDWFLVDPVVFWNYFDANEWHDKDDNPVKRWKGKIVTWHYRELRKAKRIKCSAAACSKSAVYIAGTDDTGCKYGYCEIHRPKFKPSLPPEITDKFIETTSVKEKPVDVNTIRNKARKGLGVG